MRRLLSVFLFIFISAAAYAQNISQIAVQEVETYFAGLQGVVVESKSADSVILDLGANNKVLSGLQLKVYQDGEKIVHPITGKVLGVKLANVGTLTVTDVFPEYSVAKYTGDKLPLVADQVGLSVPVNIKVNFDNATAADQSIINNMLLANAILKEAEENADYTLSMQREKDVLNYQLTQNFDKTIVLSGTIVQPKAVASSGLNALNRVSLPKGRFVSIAAGRIYANDAKMYVVAASDNNRVYILDPENNFEIKEELGKFSQLASVEVADLNKDGVDEIFVTNVYKSTATSAIYQHNGTSFAAIDDKLPYLFRSVRNPQDGTRRVICQKLSFDGEYSGEIFNFIYEDGMYQQGEALKGTLGKRILGFSTMKMQNSDEDLYINIGKGSVLTLSTFKRTEFSAPEHYGDTFHKLDIRSKTTTSTSRTFENPEITTTIEKMIDINPRIEIVDEKNYIVVENALYTRVFVASPVFSTSTIHMFSYSNGLMRSMAKYGNLDPVITDVWVYDQDDGTYIMMLTSSNSIGFSAGKSAITTFKIGDAD